MGCICGREAAQGAYTPVQEPTGEARRLTRQMAADQEALQGRYTLLAAIGRGTTSTVYSCRRAGGGYQAGGAGEPQFACKAVNLEKFRRAAEAARSRVNVVEQLRVEVQVLRTLQHPNIIQLVDVVETGRQMFIVTELMQCELFEHILEQRRLKERDAAALMHDVASAIAYMHEQGVMHRDLKPENLLMTARAGGGYTVKVVDFGLSRTENRAGDTFMGTAGYLAPELRQRKVYSKSVDVWGLGVIMYLLLSGMMPFGAEVAPLSGAAPPVAEFALRFPEPRWAGVSASAKHLLWSMLQVDPDLRISAADVLRHPWIARRGELADNVVPSLHGLPLDRGFNSFFLEPHTVGRRGSITTGISPPLPPRSEDVLGAGGAGGSARMRARKTAIAATKFTASSYSGADNPMLDGLPSSPPARVADAVPLTPEVAARRKIDFSRNRPARRA